VLVVKEFCHFSGFIYFYLPKQNLTAELILFSDNQNMNKYEI